MLRIKEILRDQGKTQIDLANELSVTPIGLNKIINGNPTLETLNKIAKVLGVELRDLFELNNKGGETIYIKQNSNYIPIGKLTKNLFHE